MGLQIFPAARSIFDGDGGSLLAAPPCTAMPRADRKESLQRAPQCTPSGHIEGCKCFKNGAGGLLTMGFTKQKTAGPASAPEPGRPWRRCAREVRPSTKRSRAELHPRRSATTLLGELW